jgi:4,5-DOPA dioxygenase extradiol
MEDEPMTAQGRMPVLFIGHGSPMNAIENNEFSTNWANLADDIPEPSAILCISAHWLTEGTAVTAMKSPRTIHDFYGFPEELYAVQYPARGSEEFALAIREAVKTTDVCLDYEWGLDHGTWSVLVHLYPAASIPVMQLSLDYNLQPEKQFKLGSELAVFRDQGVLIIGSGNVVHNLMMMSPRGSQHYTWAEGFDDFVRESLETAHIGALIDYSSHRYARLAHPTNDHYLPLLYAIGAAGDEKPRFFNEKIVYGSGGMRCVAYGM